MLEDYLAGSSAFMGDTTFANAGYWTDGTNYCKGVEVRGKKGQTRVDYTPIGNAPDFETWQRENPDKNLSPDRQVRIWKQRQAKLIGRFPTAGR